MRPITEDRPQEQDEIVNPDISRRALLRGALVGGIWAAGCRFGAQAEPLPPLDSPQASQTPQTPAKKSKTKKSGDAKTVREEHDAIGVADDGTGSKAHTQHPDAQWFPDAGFGLFIHWGIASVKAMNISWPMIPGRVLATKKLTPDEIARIVREDDYNLKGKPNEITPNEYWAMAKDFNPQKYDPDKWLRAAKEAGFVYAVLTTRHHEGFALWPSKYGDFDTKNYMGGRDLVKDYVEACRKNGLKVGFYYSPPNWYFDREYMNFLYGRSAKANPDIPPLGPDLKPRTGPKKTPQEIAAHQAAYAAMVKGQVEELLTRYGKIDLLWFDGKPAVPNGSNVITPEEIRKLQPGIVMNPRLHGHGDFVTYERHLPDKRPDTNGGWAEFCDPWTGVWSHTDKPFRSNGFVLGELARSRAWGVNFLLDVGPMATGEFTPAIYENMAVVRDWMKHSGESVHGTKPLPDAESASVPATGRGKVRYLFAIPEFKNDHPFDADMIPPTDVTLTLKGAAKPASVTLLSDGKPLEFTYTGDTVAVKLPAARRTKLVDVARIELT